jgi:hypothetical protein
MLKKYHFLLFFHKDRIDELYQTIMKLQDYFAMRWDKKFRFKEKTR